MTGKGNQIRYVLTMAVIFGFLMMINIGILAWIQLPSSANYQSDRAGAVSDGLVCSEAGCHLFEEVCAGMERRQEFALLLDDNGKVIWEYNRPAYIPTQFTLKEIVSFNRWYLADHPVFTRIRPDGILVVGEPIGSVWRYNIILEIGVLEKIMKHMPFLLAGNILLLIWIAYMVARSLQRRDERERSGWIAGVSHDIRTPLAIVLANADRLAGRQIEPAAEDRVLQIRTQTLRIKSLVENLNAENRLSFGTRLDKEERIAPAGIIRDVFIQALDAQEEQFEGECTIDPALETLRIHADESLFRRILENLIGNSIRHNPRGCRINVSLTEETGGKYLLSVSDNGTGADPDRIKKLNEPPKTIPIAEHGLGLRVVKQIASRYRWKVHFDSTGGNGFRCRILIR